MTRPLSPLSRRQFLQTAAVGAAATAFTARSYAQILGANDRVNFAVIGLNGRAGAHLSALAHNTETSRLTHVVDVDSVILERFTGKTTKALGYTPIADKDFRKTLEAKDVDAITIATPEHWHAPMAIDGVQAGKHVYVEKPCSFNPSEGELLVAVQKKYNKHVQMGSQQRSSPHSIEIIGKIHDGLIGDAVSAKTWYVNNRKSIGIGKQIAPPPTLDWELWQGPAPRRPYQDNLHPYNWHWFKHYGTGESLNNGSHEVDLARWALQVGMPTTVTASGGRLMFKDDWQFYDTLETSFEYPGKFITWEGHSCQAMKIYDRDRGVVVRGTKGSVLLDRDGYEIYDPAGKKIDEFKVNKMRTSSTDTVGADVMTNAHFANFIAAIQHGEKLRQPVESGNVCCTMLQLSNIAYDTHSELHLDANGHITGNPIALAITHREYEKGWAPKL